MKKELTVYEKYHSTEELLSLQKKEEELCCDDELSFQIIPQICELHFKLVLQNLRIAKINIENRDILKSIYNLRKMVEHVNLATLATKSLDTMKPNDFHKIRVVIQGGSGQDSPGFIEIKKAGPSLWEPFFTLLNSYGLSLVDLHLNPESQIDLYKLMEELMNFDQAFKNYRYQHMFLVKRTIGINSISLKGIPSKMLEAGTKSEFYPRLWRAVEEVTDQKSKNPY